MTAEALAAAWSALVRETLRRAPGVAGRVVFADEAGRAGLPVLTVGAIEAKSWNAAERPGRELFASVTLTDRGAPGRLEVLVAAVEAALAAASRGGAGWETSGTRLLASRMGARRDGAREARLDFSTRAWVV